MVPPHKAIDLQEAEICGARSTMIVWYSTICAEVVMLTIAVETAVPKAKATPLKAEAKAKDTP